MPSFSLANIALSQPGCETPSIEIIEFYSVDPWILGGLGLISLSFILVVAVLIRDFYPLRPVVR